MMDVLLSFRSQTKEEASQLRSMGGTERQLILKSPRMKTALF
jgi:hypothetical protein